MVIDNITGDAVLTITANAQFGAPVGVGGITFDIFSLDFTALPPPGQTSLAVGLAGFGNITDGSGALEVPMTFGAGTVNISAVPVPAAAWLFGSGLIGLVGIARRKTQLA